MTERHIEHCIYCGGEFICDSDQEDYFKCPLCGSTLIITDFESELTRLHKAIEEGEKAKKELQSALKEKADMQERVNRMVSALSSIEHLEEGQKSVFSVLETLAGQQEHSDQKLQALHQNVELLLKSQDDISSIKEAQSEIFRQLKASGMEAEKCQELISVLASWCENAHAEDIQRLKEMDASITRLQTGQQQIDHKVELLQLSASRTQETLTEFRNQYSQDRLEELARLYHEAARLQVDREFDKADRHYRQVLIKGGRNAEVYWRILLCHYCVSYQKDDDGRYIPIILNPDLTAPDEMSIRRELQQAAREEGRNDHAGELAEIDRILDKYRQVSGAHSYDVFISVKQRWNKRYTHDSDIASDLYDFLTEKGLKVFNSRRTRIPPAQEYEPYIISALMSAKVMIVVGGSPENMESQWVKNEWSRFQWLQKKDIRLRGETNRLLVCYLTGEMMPYDIPRALNPNRQAIQDGIHAQDQLLDLLEGMIPSRKKVSEPPVQPTQPVQPIQPIRPIQPAQPAEPVQPVRPPVPGPYPTPSPAPGTKPGKGDKRPERPWTGALVLVLALIIGSVGGTGLYRYYTKGSNQGSNSLSEALNILPATEAGPETAAATEKKSELHTETETKAAETLAVIETEAPTERQTVKATEPPTEKQTIQETEPPTEKQTIRETEPPTEKQTIQETEPPTEKQTIRETEPVVEETFHTEPLEAWYCISAPREKGIALRETPSEEAKILCRIPWGALLFADSRSEEWLHTSYEGYDGWLDENSTAEITIEDEWYVISVEYIVDGVEKGIAVRKGPGTDGNDPLLRVPKGTRFYVDDVCVDSEDVKWGHTFIQNVEGWVALNCAEPADTYSEDQGISSPAAEAADESYGEVHPADSSYNWYCITNPYSKGIALRDIPSGDGEVLCRIPWGTIYQADAEQDGWLHTWYDGYEGWTILEASTELEVVNAWYEISVEYIVDGYEKGIAVRSGPGSSDNMPLVRIPKGTQFFVDTICVDEEGVSWGHTFIGDIEGWVALNCAVPV